MAKLDILTELMNPRSIVHVDKWHSVIRIGKSCGIVHTGRWCDVIHVGKWHVWRHVRWHKSICLHLIDPCVNMSFLLDHTCHFLIGPCILFLLVHVLVP
jgi:hypothetical protein